MVKMLGENTETVNIAVISCIFYNMIDVAGLAFQITYKEQPTIQDKRSTKKVLERSCQRAMYAFDWNSQYQISCDEKPFPSRCSRKGTWMTDCVTTRSTQLTLPCIVAVMDLPWSLEVVIFAETRTGNNGRQQNAVLLACSLLVTNIQ